MDLETSGIKKKFNKRKYLKNKLKTNFGSRQEGHGQAFLQKQAIKQQYFRQQKREEEKRRKKLHHMQLSKGDDELKKLELQCDDEQTKEDEDEESVFFSKLR
ncbi:uncharacterized protein LOC121863744 [Homarus americanus]|nr:uncharacterized protein LOC121863744 [Homarus americanus]